MPIEKMSVNDEPLYGCGISNSPQKTVNAFVSAPQRRRKPFSTNRSTCGCHNFSPLFPQRSDRRSRVSLYMSNVGCWDEESIARSLSPSMGIVSCIWLATSLGHR